MGGSILNTLKQSDHAAYYRHNTVVLTHLLLFKHAMKVFLLMYRCVVERSYLRENATDEKPVFHVLTLFLKFENSKHVVIHINNKF